MANIKQVIGGSIDLSKVDKTKIVKGQNGGLYYNFTIKIWDGKDQYGNDVSIVETQTKEQRDAKTPDKYLGNGRVLIDYSKPKEAEPVNEPKSEEHPFVNGEQSDIPF